MFSKKANVFAVLTVLSMFVLSGCKGKVETVKDSYWYGEKGITIGKALDNYKYFESKDWKVTKTDNGIESVEFTGTLSTAETLKNIEKTIAETKAADPTLETLLDDKERMKNLYTSLALGGSFGAAMSMNSVGYVVANDVKKFIDNNGKYVLAIRFKVDKNNKDKEKLINVDSMGIIDKATNKVIDGSVDQNKLFESIYKEKQLYGKEGLDGDPYWIMGLKIFMGTVEDFLKNAAADGQRQMLGR